MEMTICVYLFNLPVSIADSHFIQLNRSLHIDSFMCVFVDYLWFFFLFVFASFFHSQIDGYLDVRVMKSQLEHIISICSQ